MPSLALPDLQSEASLQVWQHAEAMQLFATRAQDALPSFRLTDENTATVAQICRQLDGIPLAIELAAARVKMLDVEQIATRLEDGIHLLARGSRQAAPRHQTMRAALDWSFGLLSRRAQRLFGRLAVFAGGFTLEAVEHAGSESDQANDPLGIPRDEVLDVLSDLVDKSMGGLPNVPRENPYATACWNPSGNTRWKSCAPPARRLRPVTGMWTILSRSRSEGQRS